MFCNNSCCCYNYQPSCHETNETKKISCRPAGRSWGRACGPCNKVEDKIWREDVHQNHRPCTTYRPHQSLEYNKEGKVIHPMMCYGFGLYARKLNPAGLPCKLRYKFPRASETVFYPKLPVKPQKTYSNYTYTCAGAPYTCNKSFCC